MIEDSEEWYWQGEQGLEILRVMVAFQTTCVDELARRAQGVRRHGGQG